MIIIKQNYQYLIGIMKPFNGMQLIFMINNYLKLQLFTKDYYYY